MLRHNICMAQDFQNIHEYYINDEMNRYFSGVHVAQFLNFFKILLCGSLFVLFFVLPSHCLSFDIQFLITLLVSLNYSYIILNLLTDSNSLR